MAWDSTNRPRFRHQALRTQHSALDAPETVLTDEVSTSPWNVPNQPHYPPRQRQLRLGEIIDPGMEDPELPVPIMPDESRVRRTVRRRQESAADRITSPILEDQLIGWASPTEAKMRGRGPLPRLAVDGMFTSEITVEGLFLFEMQSPAPRRPAHRHRAQEPFPQSAYVTAVTVAGPFWAAAGEITCSIFAVAGEVEAA